MLPTAVAVAGILILKPSHNIEFFWYMAGLCACSGLYAMLCSFRISRERGRGKTLDSECRDLAQKCGLYLSRARAAEGNVESLALIREIHRTGNVTNRAARFRGIIAVVAQTAEAVKAELFTPEGINAYPALSAAMHRLSNGEFFVYFNRPCLATGLPEEGLGCRRVSDITSGNRRLLRGEITAGKDTIGFAELVLIRNNGSRQGRPTAKQLLEAEIRGLDMDPAGAEQALEHRQVFRVHDQIDSSLTLSYPLMAEGSISGAMRLKLPAEAMANRELSKIEELLQETAGHVGLVIKKDEDVQKAKHDGLTGLLIKKEMLRDMREELSRSASGGKLAVLMMDIDHFKAVNDNHGHLTGDIILKAVAESISSHIRGCDRAYRYGGEEMSVLLPGADEAAAGRTAERLRRAIAKLDMVSEAGKPVPITVSIGIYDLTHGRHPSNSKEMISRADQALYFSKENGRNRCSVWRPAGALALPRGRGKSMRPVASNRDSKANPVATSS